MSQTLYSIPAGSYNSLSIPSTAVPDGFTSLLLQLECSEWTDTAAVANISFQISVDGGSAWGPLLSFVVRGGTKDRSGNVLMQASGIVGLPAVSNRQVKMTGLVSSSALVTSGIILVAD